MELLVNGLSELRRVVRERGLDIIFEFANCRIEKQNKGWFDYERALLCAFSAHHDGSDASARLIEFETWNWILAVEGAHEVSGE